MDFVENKVSVNSLSYCLIAASGLQSVALLAITIAWSGLRNVNNEPKTSKLCYECEKLIPQHGNDEIAKQIEMLRVSSSSQCCGGTEEMLRLAAQKETKNIFYSRIRYMVTDTVYQMCDSHVDQTPYVQAVGITGSKHFEALYQLLWNQNGKTVTQPSIRHITHLQDEGEIFIRRSGLYIVSSQLVIQVYESNSSEVFSHYIYVLSHKYGSRRMLSERRMIFLGQNQTLSNINSVFHLDLHDRISVAVTNPKHVNFSSNDNIFSAHFAGL